MDLQVAEVIRRLERDGVELVADPPKLKLRCRPDYQPPAEWLEVLRRNKPEAIQYLQTRGLAPCGSPKCGGCYVVDAETGAKIHPPKCGEDYRAWLERWEAKGRVQ